MSIITLFDEATANGDSPEFTAADVNPNQKQDPMLGLAGEFDGALVTLLWKDPNGDFQPTDPAEDIWINGKLQPLYINSFLTYKLRLSDKGDDTSISAWAFGCK